MTLDEAITLLDYHYWARDRVLAAVSVLTPDQYRRDLHNSFASVHDTLVHTYGAEWIWYMRWVGNSPTSLPDPDSFLSLGIVQDAWASQEAKVRLFTGTLGEPNFGKVFTYRLMNGASAQSVFSHMLQHMVNHASYHRGQITTMLRQLGAPAPKSQDLIVFHRERTAAHQ